MSSRLPLLCISCSKNGKTSSKTIFPFPNIDSPMLHYWMKATGKLDDWLPAATEGICENHFDDNQFCSNSGHSCIVEKMELLPSAIPTKNLGVCFVCYKNEICWNRSLIDKSLYSDQPLLQVLGEFLL